MVAGTSRWLTPGTLHDVDRRRVLALARERFEPVGVRRLDLRVELALHDQDRLTDVGHQLRRIDAEELWNSGLSTVRRNVRRQLLPVPCR